MSKRKEENFWYVLVMTDDGPKFVTSVSYQDKTAHWDGTKKPLKFESGARASDLALGLNLNLYLAYVVCQPFEIDSQPYLYKNGHFNWSYNNEEEE